MLLRLRILTIFIIVFFLMVVGRLFYWQIIKGKELSQKAKGQHQSLNTTTEKRGSIYSSDGTILAGSVESWLVFANPQKIENPEEIAEILSKILSKGLDRKDFFQEKQRILSLLNDKNKLWVPLKTRIDGNTKREIESYKFYGLGFELGEMRKYSEASTAAQLLGFVGKDEKGEDKGYFGLEGYYDFILKPKSGFEKKEINLKGLPILSGKYKKISSSKGTGLMTSINKGIQLIVEEELKRGIENYGATSGSVIVMEPDTGRILAMASFPAYDPQEYWKYSDEEFINPTISLSFEPGSIFKVIIMSSALDIGVVEPDTLCDICSGPVKIDNYLIETWNKRYYPNSNMTEVIVHSDNVGMVFVARKMGIKNVISYLDKFGFGKITGIDLQGEMSPKIRPIKDWTEVDLATVGFGQGIAVTPIQMISAVNAIANKGIWVQPRVVSKLVLDDKFIELDKPNTKKVLSKEAAEKISMMMVEAAKSGEAKWTHKKGFGIAGKTGTAQIPIEGHYDEEKTIASFVGFAPYSSPKFTMLVTLKEPKSSPWASETAAPLWYRIAERLFILFGVLPE